jgi:hypothetical protein
LSPRRQSTSRALRATATETLPHKSVELEVRISRLEIVLSHLKEAHDLLVKRHVAMQAQLDHLEARLTRP